MKKFFKKLVPVIIFASPFIIGFVWGTEVIQDCETGESGLKLCSACPDAIVNPLIRPISFAIMHLPNAIDGRPLSNGCDSMIALFLIPIDIPFFIFLTFLIKLVSSYLAKRLSKKEQGQKLKLFHAETGGGKVFLIMTFLFGLLVAVNSFFYLITPKV